jgi:hypothetical protein
MIDRNLVKLLYGPYEPPALQRGDCATCERRGDVVITSISAGRIAWPRCRGIESRGGSGLLLAGDLVRAVRSESAAAIAYWWGVTRTVVIRWQKALDGNRRNNDGTKRLLRKTAEAAARAAQTREQSTTERRPSAAPPGA